MSTAKERQGIGLATGRRWFLYVAILALGLGVYGVDRYLKSGPDAGYLPPSTTWRIDAPDLPGAWASWQGAGAYKSLRSKAPGPLQSIPVAVRKLCGIRPTPERLSFWLGPYWVAGGGDEGWCVSVRPGLALRFASIFGFPARSLSDTEWVSGWHEGFYLIASSAAYLKQVRSLGERVSRRALPPDGVRLSWAGAGGVEITVRLADDLPLSLDMASSAADVEPVDFPGWEGAAIRVTAGNPEVWHQIFGASSAAWASSGPAPLFEKWASLSEAWWRAYCPFEIPLSQATSWQLGVFELDEKSENPSPGLAFVFPGRLSDFEALRALALREHRWDAAGGWLFPVAGESRAWAIAEQGGQLYVASGEHVMPLAIQSARAAGHPVLASLGVEWEPFSAGLLALARRSAEEELLSGLNSDDVARHIEPVLKGLRAWGAAEITLSHSEGRILGAGYLARGDGVAE